MSTIPSNSNDEPISFPGEQDVDLHCDGVNFEIDEKSELRIFRHGRNLSRQREVGKIVSLCRVRCGRTHEGRLVVDER